MSVLTPSQAIHVAQNARIIAVLGIKPSIKGDQPAHFVPAYVKANFREKKLIPVPVYFPEVTEILDEPVVRDLKLIRDKVDVLDVFRPAAALPGHLDDILELHPKVVWLQKGIRNQAFEQKLLDNGIDLVVDRCLKVDLQGGAESRL
jgi:predicted CoA-binding protein